MEYVTFYDVSQAGYRHWWFPACGLIGITAGLGGLRCKSVLVRYPLVVLTLSVAWTVSAFMDTYPDFNRLSTALDKSNCEVVEGTITDFQLLPPSGIQKSESFVVAGLRFEYSGFTVTAGFNQMHSQGGPLNDSLIVRIHHLHGEIARLEIAAETK